MLESLDSTILLGFTEEARSYLPYIRRIATAEPPPDAEDFQTAFRHTHTIKGASLMIGLPELSELAGKIEEVLEKFSLSPTIPDKEKLLKLSSDIDELEVMLTEMVALLCLNADDENVETFENFDEFYDTSTSFTEIKDEEIVEEEVDPEMLEVFAEEAADLLQNISANLKILEKKPQSIDALLEIRRSSHTLKGAAGVCGFRTVSRIAHRLEDLLDYLAETPSASNALTVALILLTTDLLERLTNGGSESALKNEIELLYARFDQTLSETAFKAKFQTTLPAFNNDEHEKGKSNNIDSEERYFASSQTMSSTPAPPLDANQTSVVDEESAIFAAQSTSVKKSVVRVGLDRLDEMVKLIGEMVISRTALEQRLAQIESQLAEMNRNTTRLRRIATKLETDYESDTLGRSENLSITSLAAHFLPTSVIAANSVESQKHGFDALEFDRYTEFHQLTRELLETASDAAGINAELGDLIGSLETTLSRQRRTSEEMQEKLMRLRMVPLGTLTNRLDRTVRVTAEQENKLADFVLHGAEIELDTQVLDTLAEPLLHLLRNAVGHGIESPAERIEAGKPERGLIKLSVQHEGTHVVLNISDDGRGLNLARLREKAVDNGFLDTETAAALDDDEAAALVFLPGLSTAREISQISGRGVGMDVVRESIERQQGTIAIKSRFGEGTLISIRLPMSLAVSRALVVKAFGSRYAIPVGMIRQLTEVTEEDFFVLSQEKRIRINGKTYQVRSLNSLLGVPELAERDTAYIPTIILNSNEDFIALTLDQIIDAREIVIKPFDNLLAKIRGLVGATILGDGSVIPILDLFALVNRTAKQAQIEKIVEINSLRSHSERIRVMIVDDSPSVRRVMSNLVTKAGWETLTAKDGLEALEILQTARALPHVILSDVEMPRMDGYEFLATLRQQINLQNIPVVMITSRAGEKHRRKALEMGVAEYITKPFQDSALLETIKLLSENR